LLANLTEHLGVGNAS